MERIHTKIRDWEASICHVNTSYHIHHIQLSTALHPNISIIDPKVENYFQIQ